MLIVRCIWLTLFLILLTGTVAFAERITEPSYPSPVIVQLEVNGVIGPAISDYIERNLNKAIETQAAAVLIRMDTPGGLDQSMRQIIKQIIASPIPVITYIAPGGARAASAGTYILYASHIAAMAPATNLGAATPVQIGGFDFGEKAKETEKDKEKSRPLSDPMKHKMVNDAAAYIRGLAKIHGRNEQWAEKAVREAASLSAEEALKLNVIDLLAVDINDLLHKIDGKTLSVNGKQQVLNTQNFSLDQRLPDWRSEFLAIITNPSIAYILMMIGLYGLVFEFSNPGSIVPGTVGVICLLLALYAFQLLPVNYAGMILILLGISLMIIEAFMPSIGVLGFGGLVAFVIGSVILIDTDDPGFGINIELIAGFALSSAVFFIMALGFLLRSRNSPVVTGKEEMLGSIGLVIDNFTGTGMVRIHSENWKATSGQSLHKNEKVKVIAIDGLLLKVKSIKTQEHE